MFGNCTHRDIAPFLETIGAAVAIFELRKIDPRSVLLVSANSAFEEIAGQPIRECVGLGLDEFVPRYVERQIRACVDLCVAERGAHETELIVEREAASRWWRLLASPLVAQDKDSMRMMATLVEITDKKLLQQKLDVAKQRHAAVVENAADGIVTFDQNQRVKMMNEAARELFGIAGDNVVGWHISRLIPERFRADHGRYFDVFRSSPVQVRPMQARAPIVGMRIDGTEFEAEVTISKIKVGDATELSAVIRDVSERTKLIEHLKQAAAHDPLTGVVNRRHGMTVLAGEVSRSRRFGHSLTIAMFDLDSLKAINDRHGHACGDLALSSVVAVVAGTLRAADTLCRWGGDEFLLLLPETALDDALHWAERVREALRANTTTCSGVQVTGITASFGLAAHSNADATADALLRRAGDALVQAKRMGRDQLCIAPAAQ